MNTACAMLQGMAGSGGGYWARTVVDGDLIQHSFWLFDGEENARAAEATFNTLRDMPDAPASFVSVDVCEVVGVDEPDSGAGAGPPRRQVPRRSGNTTTPVPKRGGPCGRTPVRADWSRPPGERPSGDAVQTPLDREADEVLRRRAASGLQHPVQLVEHLAELGPRRRQLHRAAP